MAVNEFDTVPYIEEARERVTYQFTDKPVFDKYLQLLILGQVEIQEALKQVMQLRSIDTARGAQLDIIGEIVGQDRELLNANLFDYFGFMGALNAQSFGDLNNPAGGRFYSYGDPFSGNILLDDETYRLFIRVKILKNITNATPEEFLYFLKFVFNVPTSQITSDGGGEFTVLIGKELSAFERTLLTYYYEQPNGSRYYFVPKPAGVRVNFGQYPGNNFFAFQGVPNAQGFGEAPPALSDGSYDYDGSVRYRTKQNDTNVGGILATLF